MPPFHHFDETLTNGLLQRRADVYKPRVGEILVKDSILYNGKTPDISRTTYTLPLRRSMWPLLDNTVTTLASKGAAAANAVKNLLKVGFLNTVDNVNAAVEHKRHKIASYLIQAAQEHKIALQQAKEDEKHRQHLKMAAIGMSQQTPMTLNGNHNHHHSHSHNHNKPQSLPLQQQPQQQSQQPQHIATVGAQIGAQIGAHIGAGIQTQLKHPLIANPLAKVIPLKQTIAHNVVSLVNRLKKRVKKPLGPSMVVYTSKSKPLPSTTISEGYRHTYDNSYIPPKFTPEERNPYADMGVTSYKHFEDTILKELEEKEERKVEATMHTLFDEADKYSVSDILESSSPAVSINEWTPLSSSEDNQISLLSTDKPLGINSIIESGFDRPFNDVRPVCEQLDELGVQPTLFVYPASAENQYNELADSSNDNLVIHGLNGTAHKNGTNSTGDGITEKPNYPAYFIKQQQQLKKLQFKLLRDHQLKNQEMKNKTEQLYGTPSANKTRARGNYRASSATITTTLTPISSAVPITTTLDPLYLFQPLNVSDDGFRPMLPSEINKMKLKNRTPVRIRYDPSSSIQALASNVQLSVVPAPVSRGPSATSSRKAALAAKKSNKTVDTKASSSKPTNSTTSYAKTTKNMYRGAIKFGDGAHQAR